jgi:hypothetical protein
VLSKRQTWSLYKSWLKMSSRDQERMISVKFGSPFVVVVIFLLEDGTRLKMFPL